MRTRASSRRPLVRAICFDFGDTLADESTEAKDPNGVTLTADLRPGTTGVLRELKASGYALALVADGYLDTYRNVLAQHGLDRLFDAVSASEVAGAEKPAAPVFVAALSTLGLEPADYGRVMMVGNRVDRDVKGANALGLISVLLTWSKRYRLVPNDASETPDYVIAELTELPPLLERLELDRG